jgi:hypothetical protein
VTATTALLSAAMLAWAHPAVPIAAPFAPAAPEPITAGATAPDAASDAAAEASPGAGPPATDAAPPPAPAPESPAAALQAAPPGANPTHIPGEPTPPPPGRKRKSKRRDAQDATPSGDDDDGRLGSFEIRGRIFVLGEWQRGNVTVVDASGAVAVDERDAFDITVASVRPSLRWQAPQKWLSAVAEFELTRKPDLRDGFMQAKSKHLLLRAGQFKMPGSAIETASPWTLPFVRRGLLHTLLVDGLDSPWRRPGVMLRWRGAGGLHLELSGAIYQGLVVTSEGSERDKDFILAQSLSAQGLIGRAQIEAADGVQVGAYYDHRVGTPAVLRTAHFWLAGADLVIERPLAGGGLRVWLNGTAGASWFEHPSKPDDGEDATFVSARSILAWRAGGAEPEARYVEPYATLGFLDPDTAVTADLAFEAAVGVNVGLWQRCRASLQGEITRTGRNFPPGYFLGLDPDHFALLAQLGVTF